MVSVNSFYGQTSIAQLRIEKIIKSKSVPVQKPLPPFLSSLFGPSRTWKVFRKQDEALKFVQERKNDLMTFAFQHSAGERSFLVCHPVILWYVYLNRPLNERCSYEVIPQNTLSKLYLDLEFEYNCNPCHDFKKGEVMVNTIISVFINFLKAELNIDVSAENFLDLDSSTEDKFSRHIILNIPFKVFANNNTVGNIVKGVCLKIQESVLSGSTNQKGLGISTEELNDLFIVDRKGARKIFVDLTVYSRNRHFRLLGSTKLFKNAPLKVSSSNKFKPMHNQDHSMFVSSLITYFDHCELSIVNFGFPPSSSTITYQPKSKKLKFQADTDSLDKFIFQLIEPLGRIRQKIQIHPRKIKYDILGYRFCHNIKREHKSNNIFYVADLERYFLYQQCYDPECKEFISNGIMIPPKYVFLSSEDSLLVEATDYVLNDEELLEFINGDKDIVSEKCMENYEVKNPYNEFPDMNLTDSELCDIVTYSEYVL